jgi:DNA polymerase III subunit beta
MKFTTTQPEMLLALSSVSGSVSSKNTSPILENVMLSVTGDKLTTRGTDMQVESVDSIDVETQSEGATTVNAKKLLSIIKTLPKTLAVSFELIDNELIITSGRGRYALVTLPAEDYPALDKAEFSSEFAICESELHALLSSVSYAMANQDVRYYLNGAYMEASDGLLTVVATDGHRLSVNSATGHSELLDGVVIPNKTVQEITKLQDAKSGSDITVKLSRNHIQINKDSFTLTSKLIDGKYPNYKAALPSQVAHEVKVNRSDLLGAINGVITLSNEKFRGGRFKFNTGELKISANNPDREEAEIIIDCNYQGDEFEIGFNLNYVKDALSSSDEEVMISLQTPSSSAMITDSGSATHILMPVRL